MGGSVKRFKGPKLNKGILDNRLGTFPIRFKKKKNRRVFEAAARPSKEKNEKN